jgi:hypothetical protein
MTLCGVWGVQVCVNGGMVGDGYGGMVKVNGSGGLHLREER